MTDNANRGYLKHCVAKICQDVGFNSIQSTPLEVLTDLLQDYMTTLAKTAYKYALHCGSTEPNLNHLALAFKDMGISVQELKEYVRYVDSTTVFDCPKYPIPKESHLNLLKPGSREVVTRPVHIHEHLPPMHPHLEDQDLSMNQDVSAETNSDSLSPVANAKTKIFKRPGESSNDSLPSKRNRYISEEEGRPLRELSSVMMTTSGFLSPAREGKLPEAKTPLIKLEPQESTCSTPSQTDQVTKTKKRKLSPDLKKIDKEIVPDKEEGVVKTEGIKQKRANPEKAAKKQKLGLKKGLSTPSMTSTPMKLHKGNKIKTNTSIINPLSPLIGKIPKIKSPKSDKHNSPTPKDTSLSVANSTQATGYKIASEVDKQKLSIIRKITKIKEEVPEDVPDKPPVESSLSRVNFTIENVIKREMVSVNPPQQQIEVKEEVVDIESVHSPNPFDNIVSSTSDITPECPSPITSLSPSIIKQEKKKKKLKKNKDFILDDEIPKISCSSPIPEIKEEIIPENVVMNLSVPVPTASAMERAPSPNPGICLSPPTPIKKEHPIITISPPEETHVASPTSSQKIFNERKEITLPLPDQSFVKSDDFGLEILPKKLHKKEKKEKLKKKKKDKIKNKDKEEKRKLKLEKKTKDKEEKQRIKKEKKEKRKEKEAEEIKVEGSSNPVPKITLKLGPGSPTNNNEINTRKIVILPVVKKEENINPERDPSPELARFSPLVPNPKQKANKSSALDKIQVSTEVKEINDIIEPSPSIRVDSEGNKVWICPACDIQDDGTPMIGCDKCDAWYHWVCVGIQVPPEASDWYCNTCLSKKKVDSEKKKKKKGKGLGKKSKDL